MIGAIRRRRLVATFSLTPLMLKHPNHRRLLGISCPLGRIIIRWPFFSFSSSSSWAAGSAKIERGTLDSVIHTPCYIYTIIPPIYARVLLQGWLFDWLARRARRGKLPDGIRAEQELEQERYKPSRSLPPKRKANGAKEVKRDGAQTYSLA